MTTAPIWDAHSCLPLAADIDLGALRRHRDAGIRFVSINIGMDMNPVSQILEVTAWFRSWIADHPDVAMLVDTVDDIDHATAADRLAVAFDLEGALPLAGRPEMLDLFHRLGVRQVHFTYNRTNDVAGGCHDTDPGLTDLGRRMVARANKLGIVLDCSHTGERSSLDIMAASSKPVVFSHSNCRALVDHGRNITDVQIDACAKTGGVVGINGIGIFLGADGPSAEALADHIDHVVQRVGPAHAGIGLDFTFDMSGIDDLAGLDVDRAYWWPPSGGYGTMELTVAPPELLADAFGQLERRGYAAADLDRDPVRQFPARRRRGLGLANQAQASR